MIRMEVACQKSLSKEGNAMFAGKKKKPAKWWRLSATPVVSCPFASLAEMLIGETDASNLLKRESSTATTFDGLDFCVDMALVSGNTRKWCGSKATSALCAFHQTKADLSAGRNGTSTTTMQPALHEGFFVIRATSLLVSLKSWLSASEWTRSWLISREARS